MKRTSRIPFKKKNKVFCKILQTSSRLLSLCSKQLKKELKSLIETSMLIKSIPDELVPLEVKPCSRVSLP